jgi:hypothetical protein
MAESLPPLRVKYHSRMRLQRLYPVEVRWNTRERAPETAPSITVRLIMAGAQVVPTEHTMTPAHPENPAIFYVTPLARGSLRHEKLEILSGGKKVQEIPLNARVVSQKTTYILLALAFLVPWFLVNYGHYDPVGGPDTPKPGVILEQRLNDNLVEMPEFIAQNAPWLENILTAFPERMGNVYEMLYLKRFDGLAFYAAAIFLFLALLSGLIHGEKVKKRSGSPISLPAADSLYTRRQKPIGMES